MPGIGSIYHVVPELDCLNTFFNLYNFNGLFCTLINFNFEAITRGSIDLKFQYVKFLKVK